MDNIELIKRKAVQIFSEEDLDKKLKSGKNINEALSDYGKISGMAMPIIMFPSTFLIAVSGLLIPEFSRYYVKEDYKKIKYYTDKLLRYEMNPSITKNGIALNFLFLKEAA